MRETRSFVRSSFVRSLIGANRSSIYMCIYYFFFAFERKGRHRDLNAQNPDIFLLQFSASSSSHHHRVWTRREGRRRRKRRRRFVEEETWTVDGPSFVLKRW